MNKALVAFCTICACATFVVCSLILVKPNILFRQASGIGVKGYAMQRVSSDVAVWQCSVSVKLDVPKTDADVLALLKKNVATVLKFFIDAGVKESEIEKGIINFFEIKIKNDKGINTNVVESRGACMNIKLTTSDIALVEKLSKSVSELVGQGIDVNSATPSFYYTKLEDMKLELIAKATANARERAERMVENSGSKLGGILSASQGVFQVTQPLSTEVSSYGMYETNTVQKDVKCTVNVEFAVGK